MVTRTGNTIIDLARECSDRRTVVRTVTKRATAMTPDRIGDSAHDATMAETPCFDRSIDRSVNDVTRFSMHLSWQIVTCAWIFLPKRHTAE